jgi:hypothetical protein
MENFKLVFKHNEPNTFKAFNIAPERAEALLDVLSSVIFSTHLTTVAIESFSKLNLTPNEFTYLVYIFGAWSEYIRNKQVDAEKLLTILN